MNRRAIMKIRKPAMAVAAAAVLGTTGGLALPALASTHDTSHTLTFTSETVKSVGFTKTTDGSQDTDVNSTGKTIGFDVVYGAATGRTSYTVNATVTTTGGLIYGTLTSTNSGKTFSGKVTGGTGAFTGATGTITTKAISSTKTAVTIVYS
jgi:hypothetical protein